jgi:Na+-translocating ferredoxin:NAD+ oxidoreductase subunit C
MVASSGVRGGLRLDAHKERSTSQPLRAATSATTFVLPLDQHVGAPAVPMIKVGERVLRGQPLARPGKELSAWLHAPASGTVSAIEPRPAPQHTGAPSLSIVITNDGRNEDFSSTPTPDFERLSPSELRDYIGRGGIVGLGGAVFPTMAKLVSLADAPLPALPREAGEGWGGGPRLVLNGVECEPYISCDDMLMRERAQDVVLGARVLLHATGARSCVIAVEDDLPHATQSLRSAVTAAHDERIQVAVVKTVYPAGGERQLITTLFGVEVPFDAVPTDIGIVCLNVGTAAAVAQWVRDGQPLIGRIVTVTGDGVRDARNLAVPLGTPIGSLINDCGGYTERMARLIMGGSMMGQALPHDEVPVIKATNCVIAASLLDLQPRGAEMPCIRCGNCSEVCPAILLPQQLHWYAQANDLQALETYGLMDCIECGCCDYVCPSQIPLAERFHDAKPALAAVLAADADASAARARFEAREARLQRLEAERQDVLARKRQEFRDKRS